MTVIRRAFHGLSVAIYGYALYFDYTHMVQFLPIPGIYVSKFVWLTMVDLLLQILYHVVGFAVANAKNTPSLSVFHFVSRVILGPIGVAVTILFWTLLTLDENFILDNPDAKLLMTQPLFNHSIHTYPLISVLIDLFLWNHGQPSTKVAVFAISAFTALYLTEFVILCLSDSFSVHYVHSISGFWAYPILAQLSAPFRIAFFVGCFFLILIIYLGLNKIHNLFHAAPTPKKKRR